MPRKLTHKARRTLQPQPRFGRNVSFSNRHTPRQFKPNLQWATVFVDGQAVRVRLSAKQIKSLSKEQPPQALLAAIRAAAGK